MLCCATKSCFKKSKCTTLVRLLAQKEKANPSQWMALDKRVKRSEHQKASFQASLIFLLVWSYSKTKTTNRTTKIYHHSILQSINFVFSFLFFKLTFLFYSCYYKISKHVLIVLVYK